MSTLSQIATALESDKTDIRQAILSGGGTCPEGHGFDSFASDIGTIPTSTWEDITSEIKIHQAGFTLSSDSYCYYNSSKNALILKATFSGKSSNSFYLNGDLLIPVLEIPRSSSIGSDILPPINIGFMSMGGGSDFNITAIDKVQQSTSSYGIAAIAHVSSFNVSYPSLYPGDNPYIKTTYSSSSTSSLYLCAVRWSQLTELLNTDNTIICAYIGASSYKNKYCTLYSGSNQFQTSHTIKYCKI
jgi:hypothetical protein